MLFVIDTNKEAIAIAEAKKLGIPVTAILDSNCDPDGIAYPIPGNDDAARALALYCDLAARAIIDGLGQQQVEAGVDTGAAEEVEDTSSRVPAAEPAQATA
jgi:small subunit ribosomal protein S2